MTVVTPAGQALPDRRGLAARQPGRDRRPPALRPQRTGTYTCTVRFHGGTRTIFWNPVRKVTVPVDGAVSHDSRLGRSTTSLHRTARVKVGYRPVMVTTS